jgi:hypothetical protein
VAARGVAVGLARLGHQVADEDFDGRRRADGFGHARHEQVGEDGRVERAGAHRDDVGRADGGQRLRERETLLGLQTQAPHGRARGRDVRLAAHDPPVLQLGDEPHVVQSRRVDAPLARQNLRGEPDGLDEVARHLGQRGEEEVAEAVAA